MEDWAAERQDVLDRFTTELAKVTADGSHKRQSGAKPPWYKPQGESGSHLAAVFSHLQKRALGHLEDPDSGAHPYVHAAWRLLALACTENGNNPDGEKDGMVLLRGGPRAGQRIHFPVQSSWWLFPGLGQYKRVNRHVAVWQPKEGL